MEHKQLVELVRKHSTPLMITDCDVIRNNYNDLQNALPNVKLFYAIKPYAHTQVLTTLFNVGSNFDVATVGEIKLLKKCGIPANKCIFTHPIKNGKTIKTAIKYGIKLFVVDNEFEILKFKKYKYDIKLMLRISVRNNDAKVDLSKKFGCMDDEIFPLLEYAKNNGIHICGLTFHAGSQSKNGIAHAKGIAKCNEIISYSILKGLPALTIVDIGGGFPVQYDNSVIGINEFCFPIVEELNKLPKHISVIAEPGRYIVASSTKVISSIIGKVIRNNKHWYYLDDGNYGSYSGQMWEDTLFPIYHLHDNTFTYPSVLAGPTCDSVDIIREDILLPNLIIGDLIIGDFMGAYTRATATTFNEIATTPIIFVNM